MSWYDEKVMNLSIEWPVGREWVAYERIEQLIHEAELNGAMELFLKVSNLLKQYPGGTRLDITTTMEAQLMKMRLVNERKPQ